MSEASEEADEASDVPNPACKNVSGFQPYIQQTRQNVSYGKAQDAIKSMDKNRDR